MEPRRFILFLIIISFQLFSTNTAQPHKDIVLDSAKVAAFLDSVIVKTMNEQNAPGCAITIVKDTSIFFSKGYGYNDKENKSPIDPDKTLFRTASVCKTVTATVVLIARDEGLVDMNTDVNEYLTSFNIPDTYERPITLTHLLTHTPGFDDVYIGKSARTQEERLPLGQFLKEHLPERVTPPGEVYSYSNLGNALSGYVIEEAAGTDFEKYAVENLFKPLKMNSSSFTLHENQKDHLYKGYSYVDGKQTEFQFDHLNDYPAGQMLTPVNEFANFMIMHLNSGKFKGKQIVDSATINEMHNIQFKHHPKLNGGCGYAFGIDEYNGLKSLAHGGGYAGISTIMYLFPEIKMGIYVASNSSNGVPWIVVNRFMNHFFPYETPASEIEYPLTNLPEYDRNVDRFEGKYRLTRYSRNSITKMGVLMGFIGDEMPIWRNEEGMIEMYDHNGSVRRMIQIEPLQFQSIDDNYYMAFRKNNNGSITHVFTNGTAALEKIEWYEEIWFNRILFFVLITLFVLVHFVYFLYAFKHRKDDKKNTNQVLLRCAAFIGGTYLIYSLVFALLMGFGISSVEQEIGMAYGLPWYFNLAQIIPFIAIVVTLFCIWGTIKAIKKYSTAKLGVLISTAIIAASFAMVWFMYYWRLLGWWF